MNVYLKIIELDIADLTESFIQLINFVTLYIFNVRIYVTLVEDKGYLGILY